MVCSCELELELEMGSIMRRSNFVCFAFICVLTLLIIVLFLQVDIAKTPHALFSVPVKKATSPGNYSLCNYKYP